ncbi:ribosomal protein S15 [Cyphellophora europaea CBS 101466]|uniref:Ribosomal protein S15 n=1 Tax=Cyphellophora europaea (strain CBS 101466) TaxID=1220924 RepID=W2SEJ0_CYPE1|nr:ribosomal protein S15 [Cyphellophora europaea CBS 101466]ETN47040.1 ribosomal protein S15 [Cyphellophora europaea CBS 101466]
MKKKRKVRKHVDPYRAAQAKQRRAANVARQELLRKERDAGIGDPVQSRSTPFIESLKPNAPIETLKQSYMNYFVKPNEMAQSIERSKWLSEPLQTVKDEFRYAADKEKHERDHENAVKAMQSIASLENASSKDRTRININRCIEEFGRHKTDETLPPKPESSQQPNLADIEGFAAVPKRSGPDTGSPEVQVAILTAKINVLAENLYKKDKNNKRNLRLLVHRRQKHLAYLRRQDRGGPRWQNLVEKLGINDAMWKGEISL